MEAAFKQAGKVDVYVIHSSPGRERMAEYQAMGAKVITVDPGRDVARQRCKSERPARMYAVIDEYYQTQRERDEPVLRRSGIAKPAYSFPPVTSREW